jgi:hypothetical protein
MTIERAGPDARRPCDLVEARTCAFFSEGGLRGFEQEGTVALRVGPRLATSEALALIHHVQNTP